MSNEEPMRLWEEPAIIESAAKEFTELVRTMGTKMPRQNVFKKAFFILKTAAKFYFAV